VRLAWTALFPSSFEERAAGLLTGARQCCKSNPE
jgi:hypothetical protein